MNTHTMPGATPSQAVNWYGPLEIEHAFEAKPFAELSVGTMLARLAEAAATADAHRREETPGSGTTTARFVAEPFRVRSLRPIPRSQPLQVRARIIGVSDGMTVVACRVSSEDLPVVEATVVARRETAAGPGVALRHTVPPPLQTLGGWSASAAASSPLRRTA